MKRQVVLLDITAMAAPNACIAGIDIKSGATVRMDEPQPTAQFVATTRLRPFDVVEIEYQPNRKVVPPHVEDATWTPRGFKRKPALTVEKVVGFLSKNVNTSILEAFGAPTTKAEHGNHGWLPAAGHGSLATIRAASVGAERDREGRVRMTITDGAGREWRATPFQDLSVRTHERGCADCARDHLELVRAEFCGADRLVRIGLTRPYGPDGEQACWLQVTNVIVPRVHF